MQLITGDLFEQDADAICISTNGFIKSNGECVMGRGCAKKATQLYPGIAKRLGDAIKKNCNRVLMINTNPVILSFPVKPISRIFNGTNAVKHMKSKFSIDDIVPGWACIAEQSIIERSAKELRQIIEVYNWKKVVLPRPGCGAGELEWNEVYPLLNNILDDRFYCITFPNDPNK